MRSQFFPLFLAIILGFLTSGAQSFGFEDLFGDFKEMEQDMMESTLEKLCIIPKLDFLLPRQKMVPPVEMYWRSTGKNGSPKK
jgi:hypothetical protein